MATLALGSAVDDWVRKPSKQIACKERKMANWLSSGWVADTLELGAAMPRREGATALLQYYLTHEDTEYAYYWSITDGQLTGAGIGEAEEPDVELTISLEDAQAMQQGSLDATAAFMDGRISVTGDLELLLQLLPITSSDEYVALERTLASRTDFHAIG